MQLEETLLRSAGFLRNMIGHWIAIKPTNPLPYNSSISVSFDKVCCNTDC